MARFTESFDSYNGVGSLTGVASRWLQGGNISAAMISGRFGGQALQLSGGVGGKYCNLGFSSNEFSMSVAVSLSGGHSSMNELGVGQVGNTTYQIGIKYDFVTGKFRLTRGGGTGSAGTQLWESPDSYPPNVYHTIRLSGLIHPSNGELTFKLDNDVLATLTGINTQGLGDDQVDAIWCSAREGTSRFDDIVVVDDRTANLPECRIQQLLPNADGSTLDLTPSTGVNHYAVVDEPTVNTSDYLSGTSVGDLDLLGVQDLSVIPASILGVKLVGFANKTDAASRAWNLGIESSGTVDNGPDLSLTTDIQYYEHDFEEDPHTSSEWTQSGFNAIQIQPRVAV